MKISKLFGLVLSLHVGVIAVLVVQPGCSTSSPPTKTVEQRNGMGPGSKTTSAGASSQGESMDEAFNAGIPDERFNTMRSGDEFSEFDTLEPLEGPLEPYDAEPQQTVEINETSYKTHTVQKGESLWKISRDYGVSVNELYVANGLNKNSVLKIGQEIKIPVEGGSATVSTVTADSYQPTDFTAASTTYTVRKGDNLSKIAKKFNSSVGAIKAANNKSSDVIKVGEELVIPVANGSQPAPTALAPAATTSAVAPSSSGTHTVQSGEYPSKIAKMYGMSSKELMELNNISDARSLQVGQVLKVKGGSTASTSTAPAPTPAPAPVVTEPAPTPAPAPVASEEDVAIRVLEADPLVEEDAEELENPDAMFEDAEAIPVIRLEE
ncbi:LysM peptidoglycan-binding domain-containing protein [Coraliomargarita akajimensis]|uniref:Peptidoglycan-binding lysin domain protein n=1 Tax=Coraliomargarita akajimensis (strain DSM 45221 / IAM 15411 / JCM 23193 / KCTC 12865 / 04OKA010-24) TaxID=583355 RepID=D5EI43_CORAD|nr:LysM peptidoglycan-binding domain-containing protein [Coraliomargarita akajimensis]ADE56083.1 Peptidoglycan-binding lysin domain protein [Coraliomargarita akajimensis DSM 45221]